MNHIIPLCKTPIAKSQGCAQFGWGTLDARINIYVCSSVVCVLASLLDWHQPAVNSLTSGSALASLFGGSALPWASTWSFELLWVIFLAGWIMSSSASRLASFGGCVCPGLAPGQRWEGWWCLRGSELSRPHHGSQADWGQRLWRIPRLNGGLA